MLQVVRRLVRYNQPGRLTLAGWLPLQIGGGVGRARRNRFALQLAFEQGTAMLSSPDEKNFRQH
jgi:asparagine synthetase A